MDRDEALIRLGGSGQSAHDAAKFILSHSLGMHTGWNPFAIAIETADVNTIAVRIGAANESAIATITVTEVRDRAAYSKDLFRLVWAKLTFSSSVAPFPTLATDPPGFVTDAYLPRISVYSFERPVVTSRTGHFLELLRTHNEVAVIGHSSSGKTVMVAQALGHLPSHNSSSIWVHLGTPSHTLAHLLWRFCTLSNAVERIVLVLDDIHSNPDEFTRIASTLPYLRMLSVATITIVAVGWESARTLAAACLPNANLFMCAGEDVVGEIVSASPRLRIANRSQLSAESRGDLLVLDLMIAPTEKFGSIPTSSALARLVYQQLTGNRELPVAALSVLYRVAALSAFEIGIAPQYARQIAQDGYDLLVRLKILRLDGDFIRVGHRSLADLLLLHLRTLLPPGATERDELNPVRIAVEYLRVAGRQQVRATLEKLDLASLLRDQSDQHGSAFLARAWGGFQALVGQLSKEVARDPSFGNNVASAVFAAKALAEVGDDSWRGCAKFIYDRWELRKDEFLPRPKGTMTAERYDFDLIREAMAADVPLEDAQWFEQVEAVDLETFHRTWVLGLLLTLEGAATFSSRGDVRELVNAARLAQEPSGAFYPARVPWATARVLLGLAACGESIRTSDTVRLAANWLRTSFPDGPYSSGAWESGTGQWNSPLATTAMCVSALIRAGVPIEDSCVRTGLAYLLSKRSEWLTPGGEIDGALAVEAVLLSRGRWQDIKPELGKLLNWCRDRTLWSEITRTAVDSKTESSKVPFIASSLIDIVWVAVTSELPLLLQDVSRVTQSARLTVDVAHLCELGLTRLTDLVELIKQHVSDRELALRHTPQASPALTGMLAEWKTIQREAQSLQATLLKAMEVYCALGRTECPSSVADVLVRLNEIGRHCKGDAWESIEVAK